MLVYFLGTRGTVPTSGQGTMSICVDNRFLFDICPEFVQSMTRLVDWWKGSTNPDVIRLQSLYGNASFSSIEHIFISHFHLDHWGGLRHLLTRAYMFDLEMRIKKKKPIHIYIPEHSMKIFEKRLEKYFKIELNKQNESELFIKLLSLEIGEDIKSIIQVHIINSTIMPINIENYQITAYANKHMIGSMGYKIKAQKWKLNTEKFKKTGLPQGRILGQLQKNGEIEYQGKKFTREEVFDDQSIGFGYSGDTPFDPSFIKWFNDVHILIHESTYLEHDSTYHSDVHTVIEDLIKEIPTLDSLKLFLPAHISQRYTWEEITTYFSELDAKHTKIKIYPPKAWDLIHYQDHNPRIYELEEKDRW